MNPIPLSRYTRKTTSLRGGDVVFATWKTLAPAVCYAVEALPKKAPERVLLLRDPLAPVHLAARTLWPDTPIVRFEGDAWAASLARENFGNTVEGLESSTHLDLPFAEAWEFPHGEALDTQVLAADPPRGAFDLAVLVLAKDSDML